MTSIPSRIGMTMLMVYWLVMGGMAINLYYHNTNICVNTNEYPNRIIQGCKLPGSEAW